MNPALLAYILNLLEWVKDPHGHFQKEINGSIHRLVLGPQIVSLGVKTRVTPTATDPSRTRWKEVERFSYRDITVTQNSQLRMGSRFF